MITAKLTPTQQRIWDVLKDGQPHTKDELVACINDELSPRNTIHVHLTYLRRKLPPGMLLVAITRGTGKTAYRLMREICSPSDG